METTLRYSVVPLSYGEPTVTSQDQVLPMLQQVLHGAAIRVGQPQAQNVGLVGM